LISSTRLRRRSSVPPIDADNITVEIAPDGTIVLSGAVRSPAEREEAERIAAAAPGILEVENRIEVVT
jgi:osmotically-inducible protein OsmY